MIMKQPKKGSEEDVGGQIRIVAIWYPPLSTRLRSFRIPSLIAFFEEEGGRSLDLGNVMIDEGDGGQRDQKTFDIIADGRGWLVWLRTTMTLRNGNRLIPLTRHLEDASVRISRVMARMKVVPIRSICASPMSKLRVVTM